MGTDLSGRVFSAIWGRATAIAIAKAAWAGGLACSAALALAGCISVDSGLADTVRATATATACVAIGATAAVVVGSGLPEDPAAPEPS